VTNDVAKEVRVLTVEAHSWPKVALKCTHHAARIQEFLADRLSDTARRDPSGIKSVQKSQRKESSEVSSLDDGEEPERLLLRSAWRIRPALRCTAGVATSKVAVPSSRPTMVDCSCG
jgi:hypothetical protein